MKKRREERALERVQQEEELSMIARERAIAEGVELEAKEELVGTSEYRDKLMVLFFMEE